MNIEFETVAHIEAGMSTPERIALLEALIGGTGGDTLAAFFMATKFRIFIDAAAGRADAQIIAESDKEPTQ